MEQIISNVALNLDAFILIFLRVTALIVSSPVFGRRNLPNIIKICFCIVLTYVIFTAYTNVPQVRYNGILEYALLCIKELLFGLVLGYVTTLFFSIAQTAGYAIDMQMGFGMVNVFDVQSNISVPMTGNFLNIILLVTFFGVNGHLQLIRILQATFRQIPIGAVSFDPKIGLTALEVFRAGLCAGHQRGHAYHRFRALRRGDHGVHHPYRAADERVCGGHTLKDHPRVYGAAAGLAGVRIVFGHVVFSRCSPPSRKCFGGWRLNEPTAAVR